MRIQRIRTVAALAMVAAIGVVLPFTVAAPAGATTPGQVVITEWMYNPVSSGSEFVEVTNIGGAPVDMSTYTFDDNSRSPGSFSLAVLGTLDPGESGLIIETTAAEFRAEWGLAPGVKIAPSNTNNLGRNDEVNIYDGTTLSDRLTYGDDVSFPGTIRTQGKSGVPTTCVPLGANDVHQWVFSAVGDGRGSVLSVHGDIGSPGTTTLGACGPVTVVGGDGTGAANPPCVPEAPSGTGPTPAGAQAWPGSASVSVADQACAWKTTTGPEGRDMSGLVFDPANPAVLYAAKNKDWVFRLVKHGGLWVPDTSNGWGAGKQIFFPGGVNLPDSEGLTVGPDGALYVTTERDNAHNSIPLNSILRFDPTAAGTTLVPTQQWDLTADFLVDYPTLGANLGLEGVTFVPDTYLVKNGFIDQSTGTWYYPSDYPGHGAGLYFAALEHDGKLYAYALNDDGTFHRVAVVDPGMGHVMDVQYDADLQRIWALCDNTCSVSSTLLKVDATGTIVPEVVYARPTGLPNVNIEGFAIAPDSTCVDGVKEVVWSDDGIAGPGHEGHALYSDMFPCGLDLGGQGGPPDVDGDHIADNIDPEPANPANQTFSDAGSGGETSGRILDGGGRTLTITDLADPAGVQIEVGPGIVPAKVQLSGSTAVFELVEGTYQVSDPQQTTTLAVTAGGPAVIRLTLKDVPVTIVVPDGASVVYTETTNANGILTALSIDDQDGGVAVGAGDLAPGACKAIAVGNVIVGTSGNDTIVGTPRNDLIVALSGNDIVIGNGGDDCIGAGTGNDKVTTTNGTDVISAGDGNNKIDAGTGANRVTAGNGNDEIVTGDGDDTIDAGGGNNKVNASGGADSVTTGNGNDSIECGTGTDTAHAGGGNNTNVGGRCEMFVVDAAQTRLVDLGYSATPATPVPPEAVEPTLPEAPPVPEPPAAPDVTSPTPPAPGPEPPASEIGESTITATEPGRVTDAPTSAPRPSGRQPILAWVDPDQLAALLDGTVPASAGVTFDGLASSGIAGWVVQTRHLSDAGVSVAVSTRWRQAVARGQSIYAGIWATNLYDTRCAFADPWDDVAWSRVLHQLSSVATAAGESAASGMAMDLEPYTGATAGSRNPGMWETSCSGHDPAQTRIKMRQRAAQMAPIIAGVGDLLIYPSSDVSFPGSYQDAVQANVGNVGAYSENLFSDFLNGLVDGGVSVTLNDPTFCSGVQLPGRTWESGIAESIVATQAHFPAVHGSVMLWPDNDDSHGPFAPAEVRTAFESATRQATGPIILYQHDLTSGAVDYTAWLDALRTAVGS